MWGELCQMRPLRCDCTVSCQALVPQDRFLPLLPDRKRFSIVETGSLEPAMLEKQPQVREVHFGRNARTSALATLTFVRTFSNQILRLACSVSISQASVAPNWSKMVFIKCEMRLQLPNSLVISNINSSSALITFWTLHPRIGQVLAGLDTQKHLRGNQLSTLVPPVLFHFPSKSFFKHN